MRYKYLFLLVFNLLAEHSYAQGDVARRIIIIGNAHGAVKSKNFFPAIKKAVAFDTNTLVLYLGNYTGPSLDTAALRAEAALVGNTGAKAFFIPGFYEWAKGKEPGYKLILAQQRFLKSLGNPNIKMYPGDGCSGPEEVPLSSDAELLVMDTQWWLHEHSKPGCQSGCKFRTREEVLIEIEDIAQKRVGKLILFANYHPFKNTGPHSGTFGLKQHIFPFTDIRGLPWFYLPLPGIGSLYPIARNAINTRQDMNNESYYDMAETGINFYAGLRKAFDEHASTIFIAGQEHSQQLINDGKHYYITTGATGKPCRVRRTKETSYNSKQNGFTIIELTKSKNAIVKFYNIYGDSAALAYERLLADYSKFPQLAEDTATLPNVITDSVNAIADKRMMATSRLQVFMNGENYRKEWGTPVGMKVFRLNTEKGGLKIITIGGGHETRSLQMEDKNEKKWALRVVSKDLTRIIPENFQQTAASNIIQDISSGIHPYGSMVVPGLEAPLRITHAVPELFFIPNDTLLGAYRPLFANSVAFLEERKPSINNNEPVNTFEMINKAADTNNISTDQHTFLKARLIDFLIADFDRHYGQWSWGSIDSGGWKTFYPIPKDRDQALYDNDGFIMRIARKGAYSFMADLNARIKNIGQLGIVGRNMDMYFLNRLSAPDWQNTLAEFKFALTDTVIQNAVLALPSEAYAIRGKALTQTLINRRNTLAEKGMEYYRFLARKVNVTASNQAELFKITGTSNNGVAVQIYSRPTGDSSKLIYSRTFYPPETKEVRLYGFGGNDYFDIDESVSSKIKLHLVGGNDEDTFNIRGKIRNILYDRSDEKNGIIARSHTSKKFSRSPVVNEFSFRENIQDKLSFPRIAMAWNEDDGFLFGLGIVYKKYGFRKIPYSSMQRLSGIWATNHFAYRLKYKGEFIEVVKGLGIIAKAEMQKPALKYFFGFGNETIKDKSKPPSYYRTRYDFAAADLLLRRRFLNDSIMSISFGPSVFHYWNDGYLNHSRILEYPSFTGLDSANVYTAKTYGGGKVLLTVNNLNDELVPERGISWNTEFTALGGLRNSKPFTSISSSMDIYATLSHPSRLIAGIHLGGGHILSKHYEYFQAFTIGSNNYLRGFRINRFSGSSMAYASLELRLKVVSFNAYVMKGELGIIGFNDIGRVWVANEVSKRWHNGYGGGIYIKPFNLFMVTVLAGFSNEDQLFYGSLGTKVNLTFQSQ